MDLIIPGVIIMFVSIFISRMVSEKALKTLTTDQKGMLVEIFSKSRIYNIAAILIIMVGFYAVIYFKVAGIDVLMIAYFAVFTIYLIAMAVYNQMLLKRNNYPQQYINQNFISLTIRMFGVLIFFVLLYFKIYRK